MNERKKQIHLAVEKFTSLVKDGNGWFLSRICQRSVCPTTSVECYIKDCGKTKYLKQLDRFVFDEKKALVVKSPPL